MHFLSQKKQIRVYLKYSYLHASFKQLVDIFKIIIIMHVSCYEASKNKVMPPAYKIIERRWYPITAAHFQQQKRRKQREVIGSEKLELLKLPSKGHRKILNFEWASGTRTAIMQEDKIFVMLE